MFGPMAHSVKQSCSSMVTCSVTPFKDAGPVYATKICVELTESSNQRPRRHGTHPLRAELLEISHNFPSALTQAAFILANLHNVVLICSNRKHPNASRSRQRGCTKGAVGSFGTKRANTCWRSDHYHHLTVVKQPSASHDRR